MSTQQTFPQFGPFVRDKLKIAGVPDADFAKQLGITTSTFRTYLSRNTFPGKRLKGLAEKLGVSEKELRETGVEVTEGRQPSRAEGLNLRNRSSDILPLLRAIAEANPEKLSLTELEILIAVQAKVGFVPSQSMINEILSRREK